MLFIRDIVTGNIPLEARIAASLFQGDVRPENTQMRQQLVPMLRHQLAKAGTTVLTTIEMQKHMFKPLHQSGILRIRKRHKQH
jgi:hypothetical protein